MFHAFSGMGGEIFIPLTLPYLSLPYVIIPFILIEAVFIPTIAKRRNYKDKSRHNCCLGKRIFNGHGNTCFNSTSLHFAVCHFSPLTRLFCQAIGGCKAMKLLSRIKSLLWELSKITEKIILPGSIREFFIIFY